MTDQCIVLWNIFVVFLKFIFFENIIPKGKGFRILYIFYNLLKWNVVFKTLFLKREMQICELIFPICEIIYY